MGTDIRITFPAILGEYSVASSPAGRLADAVQAQLFEAELAGEANARVTQVGLEDNIKLRKVTMDIAGILHRNGVSDEGVVGAAATIYGAINGAFQINETTGGDTNA